ncbi:MAG: dTDP-4-dehydrorhamnose reductase [Bacillota bacterium]
MKILIIGRNGQLGRELHRTCQTLGTIVSVDFPEIDLSKTTELRSYIQMVKPNIIINAAAYTNVDKAESEPEMAYEVNAIAPLIMAEEIRKFNGALVHYSTDYVFDGNKNTPYVETDLTNPINVYGTTKLEGEKLVQSVNGISLIFRTSWMFSLTSSSFVTKVLRWAREQEKLKIVDDQISNPTSASMLAEITAQVISQGKTDMIAYLKEIQGMYHLAGSGYCSRYEWARTIIDLDPMKAEQLCHELVPVTTQEFPTPAKRPLRSSLDCNKFFETFGLSLPLWYESLRILMQA